MAYNNGYYNNGMNGYQQPVYNNGAVPDQLAQYRAQSQQPMLQQPQQFPMQQNIGQQPTAQIWVQGEAAAKAFWVANGNSVVLWDSEDPVIYLKSVDISGMPSLRIFDLKERITYVKEPPATPSSPIEMVDYITRAEFNKLEDKLNALLEKENEHDSTVKSVEGNKFNNKSKEEKRNG